MSRTCCDARDYDHDGKPGQCGRALVAMMRNMAERPHREAERERAA